MYLTWQVGPEAPRAVGGMLYLIIHRSAPGVQGGTGPGIEKEASLILTLHTLEKAGLSLEHPPLNLKTWIPENLTEQRGR